MLTEGRVTWLDAGEKVDRDRLLRVAVAAVTGGRRFLEQATIGGSVLWVTQEAAADLKSRLAEVSAPLDKVFHLPWTKNGYGRRAEVAAE